jgi:ATP-binding cassette subfamily B protein
LGIRRSARYQRNNHATQPDLSALAHFDMSPKDGRAQERPRGTGLFALLQPYWGLVTIIAVLTISANGLMLVVPKLISHAIDAYAQRTFVLSTVVLQFFLVVFFVLAMTYLQSIMQTYASERVARDLRMRLAAKIATQSYSAIEKLTPARLLTNLTSDVDGVKLFVSQAVATIIASLF